MVGSETSTHNILFPCILLSTHKHQMKIWCSPKHQLARHRRYSILQKLYQYAMSSNQNSISIRSFAISIIYIRLHLKSFCIKNKIKKECEFVEQKALHRICKFRASSKPKSFSAQNWHPVLTIVWAKTVVDLHRSKNVLMFRFIDTSFPHITQNYRPSSLRTGVSI